MKTARFVCSFAVLAFATLLNMAAAPQSNLISHASQPGQPLVTPAFEQSPALRLGAPLTLDSGGFLAQFLAVADLNSDGHLDLVVANAFASRSGNGDGELSVIMGDGDGYFQSPVAYDSGGFGATSVAVADVNGDGHPDLIAINQCQSNTNCNTGIAAVLLANGDGTFQSAVIYNTGGFFPNSIVVADVNGDGHVDLVISNRCVDNTCANGSVSVLLGNGDGTFRSAVSYGSGGNGTGQVAVGDLNGDGHLDLVVVNGGAGAVAVLMGNGDGTFQAPLAYQANGFPVSVAIGDLNGDHHADLAIAIECLNGCQNNGGVSVLLNQGNGTFQAPVTYDTGAHSASFVAIGDVNGDSFPDLVVTDRCANGSNRDCHNGIGRGRVSFFSGNGDGTFQPPAVYGSLGFDPISVVLADVNGVGRPDLVVTNEFSAPFSSHGKIEILFNGAPFATSTALASSQNPSHVGQSVTFTATVSSSSPVTNGDAVDFYNGTTFIGYGTTTNGVATLTTTFSAPGTYSIKAKFTGDRLHGKSGKSLKQVVNP